MSKDEEKQKANERGQELSPSEEALEDARDAWHADKDDESLKLQFKAAQEAVVAQRVTDRRNRESQPAPPGSTEIRDATGKVYGWTTPAGDAVAAQGGAAG
jgi:hypothetical protein